MDLPDLTGVGYLLIGCYIGLILFGVTVVQTWIYFLRFLADDPCMLKLMVILVVLADTANAVCQCIANYQYLVQRHDPARMLPAFLGALETSTLTAMLTQLVRRKLAFFFCVACSSSLFLLVAYWLPL